MIRQPNYRNRLLASIVCLALLPSLAQSFVRQSGESSLKRQSESKFEGIHRFSSSHHADSPSSFTPPLQPFPHPDALTVFLDEEIKKFESFTLDRLQYRLSMNGKYHYFNYTFLNYSDSPRSVEHTREVIDMYGIYEFAEERIVPLVKIFTQWETMKKNLTYWKINPDASKEIIPLGDAEVVDKLAVKFNEDPHGIGTLVYAVQRNENSNKTIWLIHSDTKDTKDSPRVMKHWWKTSSSVQNNFGVRIIPKDPSKFFFLYYDFFDKKNYTDDRRFVNFGDMILPQLGLYPSIPVYTSQKPDKSFLFIQIPIFCAPDYGGSMSERLYTTVIDAAHVNLEKDTAFFFLMENQYDQSQAVCLMNSKALKLASDYYSKPADFRCDEQLGRCIPSNHLPLNSMVLQFKKSIYERILVKPMNSKATESIIFLLEKGRQQLQIFNLFRDLDDESTNRRKVCFEGIYKLRSQMETILDIKLEVDSLLVITGNYIQRIPIGSFCTPHSFSSCQSVSTCSLGSATCNHPEHSKRGCLSLDEIKVPKMSSEEYMCERENKDICLVGRIEPQTKSNYENKICGENSCRCQVGH